MTFIAISTRIAPPSPLANAIRRGALFAAGALLLLAAHNDAALAAAASAAPKMITAQDWQGIWTPTGSTKTFDPTGKPPPYNPEWQQKYAQIKKEKNDKKRRDPLETACQAGVPRLSAAQFPFSLTILLDETVLNYGRGEVRHIWTDGREHPPIDEQWPMTWGDSIGRWEGKTLVIDTVSMRPELWVDGTGARISSQAQLVERITFINKHKLENEITINDPTSLTKPWTVKRTYKRASLKELPEDKCKPAAAASKAPPAAAK